MVGKPQAAFFQQALGTLGCSPGDAVMIGWWEEGSGVLTLHWQSQLRDPSSLVLPVLTAAVDCSTLCR